MSKFIFKNNKIEYLINDDLVGNLEYSQGQEGIYIKYIHVSEAHRNKGIGSEIYRKLLFKCKSENIKLFKMKNPTLSAQKVWAKLEKEGLKFIDRKDLMSTNEEVQVDYSNFN